jgi:repressor LexA
VRLPETFIGNGKFYFLKASGNSMIGAGINDGDLVLIKQQTIANVGDIIVALVENEVTLKRLAYDEEQGCHYLHPENKRMKDIYPDCIEVQGVAVKVVKDLM